MASIIPTTLLFDVGLGLPSFSSRKTASFLVILVFGVLLVLERQFPNSKAPTHKLRSSYLTNISLFIFNNTVLSLLLASTLLVMAEHHSNQGLLAYLSHPVWQGIVAFWFYR